MDSIAILRDVLVLFCLTTIVVCQQKASGNAMDLALMTMNMMGHNSNCAIQPCQSVCQVLNQTSGCYVCSTSCNAGSGSGINAPLNPQVQMPISGVSGCDSRWMQCPTSCTRSYTYGCVKCDCGTTTLPLETRPTRISSTKGTVTNVTSPSLQHTQKVTAKLPQTTTAISTSPLIRSITPLSSLSTTPVSTTQSPLTTKAIISSTQTPMVKQTSKATQLTTTEASTVTKLDKVTRGNMNTSDAHVGHTSTSKYASDDIETNSDENALLKNILVFVLSTCLVVSLTLSCVLFIVWRRSARKLRRKKNELYFIQKSYRQDSKARSQSSAFDFDEPIYARIDTKPEVPPRSPPLTPISPTSGTSLELLLRTESLTSDTSVKKVDDFRHDYLELI